ncbi:hypothetical protein ACHWQZ_G016282 [Mnemiopsis leidyi]
MSSFMIQSLLEPQNGLSSKAPKITHSGDDEGSNTCVKDIAIKSEPEDCEVEYNLADNLEKQMVTYEENVGIPEIGLGSHRENTKSPGDIGHSLNRKQEASGDNDMSPGDVSPNSVSPGNESPSNNANQDQKPAHSYVAIIAMAILESSGKKLVLSDIYKYILDKYPYFKNKGQGWRNSVRHNLSLNQCFAKAGRAENGKGNYWTIHPANMDDFKKGDFRRRLTRRSRRKYFNELSHLNPLISPVSLLKHDSPRTDVLLSALFKYNLSNLVSSQSNTMFTNHLAPLSSTQSTSTNILSNHLSSLTSSTQSSFTAGNLPTSTSFTPGSLSTAVSSCNVGTGELSALSSFSPSNTPSLSLATVAVPSSSVSVSGGSSTGQLLPTPPSLQLSSSLSSIFNADSSSLFTKSNTREQYIPTLLSKKPHTPSPTRLLKQTTPPLDTRLTDALNCLNLPTLTADSSILRSHLLASYKMQQWLSHCEKALNSKGL